MNIDLIKEFMRTVQNHSPKCFINSRNELIVEPKNNIYFQLEGINTDTELKCRIIAWLSRPSCKGVSEHWQKKIRAIVNEYLGTKFTPEEMRVIYTQLGNDSNRELTLKFIESNYNMKTLANEHDEIMKNKIINVLSSLPLENIISAEDCRKAIDKVNQTESNK